MDILDKLEEWRNNIPIDNSLPEHVKNDHGLKPFERKPCKSFLSPKTASKIKKPVKAEVFLTPDHRWFLVNDDGIFAISVIEGTDFIFDPPLE